MIKYNAVERKINVLVCADWRWQWPAGQQTWEQGSAAKVVERKSKVLVEVAWGVKRGGLPVPNGWWC